VTVNTAPYGTWPSPITMDVVLRRQVKLRHPTRADGTWYWAEQRPEDGGRTVVVRREPDGRVADVTPPDYHVRTRAHEYGGRSYWIYEGAVWFCEFSDQRLYRQVPGQAPVPVTAAGDVRYADVTWDAPRRRLIAVREDHTTGASQAVTTLVGLDPAANAYGTVLVCGHDFYSDPRVSPDGQSLLWLAWNHPHMPWDGTELWVGRLLSDGRVVDARQVGGGPDESLFQPVWSPDGVITVASDRSGWWNLYRWEGGTWRPVAPMQAEFGRPQWQFGMTTYGYLDRDRVVATFLQDGKDELAIINVRSGQVEVVDTPYTWFDAPAVTDGRVGVVAGAWDRPPALMEYTVDGGIWAELRTSQPLPVDSAYLSRPEPLDFPTEGGRVAHAFFYPPKHPAYRGPDDERPPLIVVSHGGPTGFSDSSLNLEIQYWTSRGLAVVDVNYGGSAGYGRAYRERLKGQWGIVDVDDCVNAARYLAEAGRVDRRRIAIRGGSAGGYTTLAALTFRDVFRAGASYFGVSDCEALARETHKFESHYLDTLIGPWPEAAAVYRARSPLFHVERLKVPVIFFQGLQDKVVPPNQAERMVEHLAQRGIPVAYLAFPDEGHGFRRAENIKRAQEAELYFYGRVFGFTPADQLEPVPVANLG
jgi:dipeptidyl aminopeptidase/acylaminoacyl peptidase